MTVVRIALKCLHLNATRCRFWSKIRNGFTPASCLSRRRGGKRRVGYNAVTMSW